MIAGNPNTITKRFLQVVEDRAKETMQYIRVLLKKALTKYIHDEKTEKNKPSKFVLGIERALARKEPDAKM